MCQRFCIMSSGSIYTAVWGEDNCISSCLHRENSGKCYTTIAMHMGIPTICTQRRTSPSNCQAAIKLGDKGSGDRRISRDTTRKYPFGQNAWFFAECRSPSDTVALYLGLRYKTDPCCRLNSLSPYRNGWCQYYPIFAFAFGLQQGFVDNFSWCSALSVIFRARDTSVSRYKICLSARTLPSFSALSWVSISHRRNKIRVMIFYYDVRILS